MPSRRAHKKSRLGCQECKRRKVKCSEARPSCSYCIRANCTCIYPISTSVSAPKIPPESIYASSLSPNPSSLSPYASSLSLNSFTTTEQPITTFDSLDLTLMNHFTAVTALSMFSGEKQRLVWQTDIHFKARSNPVLMHGILSVAAVHLALLEPENWSQYRLRALHHHDIGVRLFNQQLSNITPESSQILFPFAVMLVVWAYASPIIAKDDLQLDDIFGLLELARGCKTIFMLHWDSIQHTPISSITDFIPHPRLHQVDLSYVALRALENLRLVILDSTYGHAIARLDSVFVKTVGESDDVRSVVAWPCFINEEVWRRLRAHDTEALFLLAHYAMLLDRYETQWWWVNGWSRRILTAVEHALSDTDKESLGWDTFLSYVEDYRKEFLDVPASVE